MLINGTLAGAFYKWVKPYPPTSSFKIRLFTKALEVLQLELSESVHELKVRANEALGSCCRCTPVIQGGNGAHVVRFADHRHPAGAG